MKKFIYSSSVDIGALLGIEDKLCGIKLYLVGIRKTNNKHWLFPKRTTTTKCPFRMKIEDEINQIIKYKTCAGILPKKIKTIQLPLGAYFVGLNDSTKETYCKKLRYGYYKFDKGRHPKKRALKK